MAGRSGPLVVARSLANGFVRQKGGAGITMFLRVDFVFLIYQREEVSGSANGLGISKHQEPILAQSVMEDRHDFALQRGVEVNEHIAAGDHVEIRKRWI